MKFENNILCKAKHVEVGDKVCFELSSSNYVVTETELTAIGMVRHWHSGGSNCYWPNELLYVECVDPITEYYTDRNNSGRSALSN